MSLGFFPLNAWVTLYKSDEGSDEWGVPVKTDNAKRYKVRLDYNGQSRVIQIGDSGTEIVYNATILFRGAVPISYTDYVEYDSGHNGLVKAQPKHISAMTDMSGKVIYTRVIL